MKQYFAAILILLTISIDSALTEELRIWAVDEPPSSFIKEQAGKKVITGFSVDIVREIQRKIGDTTPIEIIPEARVFDFASTEPNIVFFSFSRTPERENMFHWIVMIMRKPWVLYAKKNTDLHINSIADLKKVDRIGVVRGDARTVWLEQHGLFNIEEVSYHEMNLKKLMADRISLFFYEPQGLAYMCRKLGYDIASFEPVLMPYISDVYIAMSKQGTPLETVKLWKDAAIELQSEGIFQRISEKWAKYIIEQYNTNCEVKNGILNF
ncbi:MAG: ABC transporter substrate-binding protein [Desulfamplus sp.]|nr:ABC transporter substrate-binding protein [Desulfamplus sp.]